MDGKCYINSKVNDQIIRLFFYKEIPLAIWKLLFFLFQKKNMTKIYIQS